jgi:exosortase/archaeosortase family protein
MAMEAVTGSRARLRDGSARLVDYGERLRRELPHRRNLLLAGALVLAGLVAYHFTLLSLGDYLRLDTPLAYLPLLPLFTLWTVWTLVGAYQGRSAPIQDRQVDLLIGIPILVASLLLITVVPAVWSTYYWTERPDVISLALFVSAGVILLFGFNWFWRLRAPLAFLFLMWPALYLHLMSGVLQSFTDATNTVLARVVALLPMGVRLGGQPGVLSVPTGHGGNLLVSVGTACSGANSVLGFLLIGGALLVGHRGHRIAKLGWLACGLLLAFSLNVVRLTSILALASAGHPSFALGEYHAVIGLVLFAIAVAVMLLVMPWFRLQPQGPAGAVIARAQDRPAAQRLRLSRRTIVAVVAGLVLTVATAAADHDLRAYAAFIDGTGAPTVAPFGAARVTAGRNVFPVASYPWAKQYFGANSTFERFEVYRPGSAGIAWADVVRTDDRGSLDAYNLQNCFLFHNYNISTTRRFDLGDGVTGLLLNYADPTTHRKWATVSWAWPVRYHGGTYYERIALTSDLNSRTGGAGPDVRPGDGLRAGVIGIWNNLEGAAVNPSAEKEFRAADANLQALAASLVASTVH